MAETLHFLDIFAILRKHNVEYIVTGGISAVLQGAPVTTFDLDVVHKRTPENVHNLQKALAELEAVYRFPKTPKISPRRESLLGEGHHLLLSKYGPIDVLGIIGQQQTYSDLQSDVVEFELDDILIRVQSLRSLIETKRAVGRQKDLMIIPILEQTLKEQEYQEEPK